MSLLEYVDHNTRCHDLKEHRRCDTLYDVASKGVEIRVVLEELPRKAINAHLSTC